MGRGLRELERVRRERRREGMEREKKAAGDGAAATTNGSDDNTVKISPKRGVQIAESSILYKEHQRLIVPALPFFRYQIADAHLHLIVALVSNNSILSVSAVRSIWGLLTGECNMFEEE